MKRYFDPKKLRKADVGHYWIRLKGEEWDVGYLSRVGREVHFSFQPPQGYFGGGSFGLEHDVFDGSIFVGPIPVPLSE